MVVWWENNRQGIRLAFLAEICICAVFISMKLMDGTEFLMMLWVLAPSLSNVLHVKDSTLKPLY